MSFDDTDPMNQDSSAASPGEAPSGFMDSPADAEAAKRIKDMMEVAAINDLLRPADRSEPPYSVTNKLGEGGMGSVYKAERRGRVKRPVALKVISLGMNSKQIATRFEAERETLARMSHPNIATVFDGGTLADGRAYFAMEYVPGVPITAFADREKFTVDQRLRLFQQVCDAVQHAHAKGIIHRDLKPANVLAWLDGTTPRVKVIDFGVAKALGGKIVDATIHSAIGGAIGTLAYMSVEQAAGDPDIDTRSDVYSLGVLLYELLAGVGPFDFARAAEQEVLRVIREDDPPRPSTRLSSLGGDAERTAESRGQKLRSLLTLLGGELGWIPLKALKKRRGERYARPAELSADIDNYLSGRALTAGPDSVAYRCRKFVRRYKGPLIAAAAVVVLLVGGILGTTYGLLRARAAAETARQSEANEHGARIEAERRRADAEREADRARRSDYANRIALSESEISRANIARARNLLDACPVDLRHFEWHRLRRVMDVSVATLRGHASAVSSIAISGDGKRIVSGGFDTTIKVWDAEKGGKALLTLRGHEGNVNCVAVSADGKRIVSGSEDNTIRVWDAEKGGEALLTVRGQKLFANCAAISGDGKRIVSGGFDNTIKVWDAEKGGEALLTLRGHDDQVRSVALSTDGKRIVSGSEDNTIKVWDAEKGGEALLTVRGQKFFVNCVAISDDGKRIVSGSGDRTIEVWDAEKGGEALLTLRGHADYIYSIALSGDGKRIVSASSDGAIKIWDAEKGGEALLTLRGYANHYYSIAISGDGKRIVSGGFDKMIKVWDAEKEGEALLTLRGHDGDVASVALSADGKRIVSGSGDKTVKVWDAEKGGEALLTLRGHDDQVRSVALSTDGKRIVSGSGDRTIKVWDAREGGEASTVSGSSR